MNGRVKLPGPPLMNRTELHWLQRLPGWTEMLSEVSHGNPASIWPQSLTLADSRIGALQTMQLDRRRAMLFAEKPPDLPTKPIRLAVLASSTADHLLPSIRVAGLRRNIWISTYTPAYGQYAQDLMDPGSGLYRFEPDAVLFALNSHQDDSIVLTPATTAEDVDGWDSMNHIFIVVELEKRFGVKFQAAEMEELKNVGELAALVAQRLAKQN